MHLRLYRRRAIATALASLLVVETSCSAPSPRVDERATSRGRTIPEYPARAIVPAQIPIMLGGAAVVTDTGEATYTLPLWVPAGPREVEPSLSLVYRGGGGNGPLGSGFALAGLSAIAPCSQRFASEGVADGVDYDATDSYCLDGAKLVEVEDPTYAAPAGTARTYRTEVDQLARVVAHVDPALAQPAAFTVHDRAGLTHTYRPRYAAPWHGLSETEVGRGTTLVAFVYLLERTEDASGNRIDYRYDDADATGGGEAAYRIATIAYAFAGGALPTRTITFRYAPRPDPFVRYVRGVKLVNRSLVRSIEVAAPNPTAIENVWTYELAYAASTDTGDSLLASVRLCGQLGACSHTRRFAWTRVDDKPAETRTISTEVELDAYALSRSADHWDAYHAPYSTLNWVPPTDVRVMLFDIDDDGDDDALYRTAPTAAVIDVRGREAEPIVDYHCAMGTLWRRLTTAAGPLAQRENASFDLEHNAFLDANGCGSPSQGSTFTRLHVANLGKSRVLDLDGDGALELQLAKTVIEPGTYTLPDGTVRAGRWTYGFQTSAFANGRWTFPAAIAADDVAMHGPVTTGTWSDEYFTYVDDLLLIDPPFQRVFADLDGDARPDPVDAVRGLDILAFADVDWNDRYALHGGFHVYETRPSSSSTVQALQQRWACGNGRARVLDLHGDGRDDVLVTDDDDPGPYRGLALGDHAGQPHPHGSPQLEDTSALWAGGCGPELVNNPDLTMGDWNGDGLVDALYPPGSRNGNTEPLVRWNLGTGFGPLEVMPVHAATSGVSASDLRQDAPLGRDGDPVPWDRGTRTADLNGDGRTDIIAFRQDNDACITAPLALMQANLPHSFACTNRVLAFISNGDSFAAQQVAANSDAGASLANGFSTADIGDVTGDGAVDVVWVTSGKLQLIELPWRWTPDRLAQVHDDATPFPLEDFAYTRSWWGDAARPQPRACAYPLSCTKRGFEVVREHRTFAGTQLDGTPMVRTFLHTYEGFASDQRGRGSLGVREHRIWDREQGIETVRRFDHETRLDPDPLVRGGEHYPYAHQPSLVITLTPRAPMPSAAELAAGTAAPGLATSVPVRVARTYHDYEVRHAAHGRVLTVLPAKVTTQVADTTATLDPGAAVPHYTGSMPAAYVEERTTTTHDAHGSPTLTVTTTTSGLERRRAVTYEHDLAAWRLGLPTRIEVTSRDADDGVPPVRITAAAYDALGRVTEVAISARAADGTTLEATHQVFAYDAFGNIAASTTKAADEALPRTATFQYDSAGVYPVASTDATGATTIQLFHPALGVPIYEEDAIGVAGFATYDPFARVMSIVRAGAPSTTYTYAAIAQGDHRGTRVDAVRSDGRATYIVRDELGRGTGGGERGFDGTWSHRRDGLDHFGRVVAAGRPGPIAIVPTLATVTRHDRLGRALERTRADGATTAWTYPTLDAVTLASGKLETRQVDPAGHATFTTRDLDGRVIGSGHGTAVAPYGALAHAYGPFDQVERVTNALGHETRHVYDALGRRTRLVDPDAGTSEYRYNGFGELVRIADAAGATTTIEYDVLGRMVRAIDGDGVLARTYGTQGTALGRVVHEVSPDGVEVETDYDAFGRPRSVRQIVDGVVDRIEQAFDDQGRLLFRFYPEAPGYPRFATYFQWANGYLRSIDDVSACGLDPSNPTVPAGCAHPSLWTVLARDAEGALVRARHGASFIEQRTYDATTGLLAQLHVDDGATTLASLAYSYAADDLLVERIDGTRVETFTHDDVHRLTGWTLDPRQRSGPTTSAYSYDPLGNLLAVERDGAKVWSGEYGADGRPHALRTSTRAQGAGSITTAFAYDALGRQTTAGDRLTQWTHADKPRTIDTPDGWGHAYRYGTSNERVVDASASATVTYVGKLYERRADAATSHTFFIRGDAGVIAQVRCAGGEIERRHVVNDGLDSAILVLGPTGVVERSYFAPFGERITSTGAPATDPDRHTTFGFTGHEEDERSLIHMNGRIYDLAQYRFTSPDPVIGRPLSGQRHNPYSYVMNSPLQFTDPSGFDPPDVGGGWGIGWDGGGSGNGPGAPPPGWSYGGEQASGSTGGGGEHGGMPRPGNGIGGGRHADDDAYHAPSSFAPFVAAMAQMDTGSAIVRTQPVCFEPPPAWRSPGVTMHAGVRAPWTFGAPEWDAADGRHQLRKLANRGSVERLAQTTADGVYLTLQAEAASIRVVQVATAAKLLGANEDVVDTVSMAATFRPRRGWLRTPTREDLGEVFQRQRGMCVDCKMPMTRKPGPHQAQLDHREPYAHFGPADPLDGVFRCRDCNLGKSDMDEREWLESFILWFVK